MSLKASLYPASYLESRENFRKMSTEVIKNFPKATHFSKAIPSQTQENLEIDFLHIPPRDSKSKKLLILTAGIHGVEAFTGSAIQFEFIDQLLNQKVPDAIGILIVHAVNPYGYHFKRRVSENNIDLNRNFSADENNFKKKIQGFKDFADFLNPKSKLNANKMSDLWLFTKTLTKLALYGRKQIAQMAVAGQYQAPKGIYYGGQEIEPNGQIIKEVFKRVGTPYQEILHIDLHTGYGERGRLHFFSNAKVTETQGFKELAQGFSIDSGSDEDFYETSGSFAGLTLKTFKGKKVIPMTFEFGTMDSQTTLGGFYSLKNMIYENQGFQNGYVDQFSEKKIKKDFIEMFNPSDKTWRTSTLKQAEQTLKTILKRFSQ